MTRMGLAEEAQRLHREGSAGEGLSVVAVARELRIPVEEVADLLLWKRCGECSRPDKPLRRYRKKGRRLCNVCYHRQRRLEAKREKQRGAERKLLPNGRGEVPVEPLAQALADKCVDPYVVALRLGWTTPSRSKDGAVRGIPDSHRVRRYLGLRPHDGRYRQRCDYETAVKLAEAIGVDPYEVGI